MGQIEPIIRHMLLCDDVQRDAGNPHKVNILGLASTIRAGTGATFPLRYPRFCAYIEASGARGQGDWQIAVEEAEAQQPIFEGKLHRIGFGNDPLLIKGFIFRIEGCAFPARGLYWVHIRWNGKTLATQPLLVR